ncbi:MAG: PaaI family thioesterase [Nakamurella sp.]
MLDEAEAQALIDDSAFGRWWGFRVTAVGDGTATVTLPLRPEMLRPGDIAHGGCAMTLADVAVWVAITERTGDSRAVTVQQNNTFLGPARGDLSCEARLIKVGRTFTHGEATVTDSTGRLVSHHTVTYANPAGPSTASSPSSAS